MLYAKVNPETNEVIEFPIFENDLRQKHLKSSTLPKNIKSVVVNNIGNDCFIYFLRLYFLFPSDFKKPLLISNVEYIAKPHIVSK